MGQIGSVAAVFVSERPAVGVWRVPPVIALRKVTSSGASPTDVLALKDTKRGGADATVKGMGPKVHEIEYGSVEALPLTVAVIVSCPALGGRDRESVPVIDS